MHIYMHLLLWYFCSDFHEIFTKIKSLIFGNDIHSFLGSFCSFLNWEGGDIWLQIRPRKIPVIHVWTILIVFFSISGFLGELGEREASVGLHVWERCFKGKSKVKVNKHLSIKM